jgi:hypothetical protein
MLLEQLRYESWHDESPNCLLAYPKVRNIYLREFRRWWIRLEHWI